MSDEQLMERSNELQKKINWAASYTASGQGIEQMSIMLRQIEDEQMDRANMSQWALSERYICEPIETDPDLRDAARAARGIEVGPKSARRPRVAERRPYPTPTPHPNTNKEDRK